MEHKKYDMYKQVDAMERGAWRQASPAKVQPVQKQDCDSPVPVKRDTREVKIEKETKKQFKVEKDVKLDIEMEMELAVPELVVVMPPKNPTPVTPEMPVLEEAACGYCITPGMCYTPMTKWNETYEPEVGFHRGTIFPELDYPFVGEGACDHE